MATPVEVEEVIKLRVGGDERVGESWAKWLKRLWSSDLGLSFSDYRREWT